MYTIAIPALFPLGGNLLPPWVSDFIRKAFQLFATASPEVDREADRKLREDALSGDPGFEKLVKAYERMVYRVALRFLNDETEASDVTQEVFLRVHKALPKFRGESSLSTWIYAITSNLSRNAIRSRKNREKVQVLAPGEKEDETPFWDRVADTRGGPASRGAENKELSGAIHASLQDLPPDYREAVILRDLEDLDYGQIAEVLKTGVGTVKSRIARGRALLREKLKEWL
jgi:RNA polymerase sigma-70 factor (ECF subfamily)